MGAGRTELAMSIFGRSYGQRISGQAFLEGKKVGLDTIQNAVRHGIAYVTEDRKGCGLVLNDDIKKNITLANLGGVSHASVVDDGQEYAVVLAKWLFANPKVLILDEPTRGIDVGAKYEIYTIINQLAAEGKGVIMISSEMPELLGMCDRICVMNEGAFVGEFSAADASQEKIMRAIMKDGSK
jgi:putative multiple sugar transport system ATP-binding protein